MSMQGHLEEREAGAERAAHQAERDRDLLLWMNAGRKPEVRLATFDQWVMRELDRRLDWTWAGAHRVKRQHQCRIQIDGMVLALWKRGWMLDGKRLADRITGMLDAIGQAQRAGKVRDFWPYFKASANRYVGLNAEEIQVEAMQAGVAVSTLFQALLKRASVVEPSIPELIARRTEETLREKVNREKAKTRPGSADAAQLPLL